MTPASIFWSRRKRLDPGASGTGRAAALAACLALTPAAVLAGGLTGHATEWTQLLNNAELGRILSIESQSLSTETRSLAAETEQLRTQLQALEIMRRNVRVLPEHSIGNVIAPVTRLNRIARQAGSLAIDGRNLDTFLRSDLITDPLYDRRGLDRADLAADYDSWTGRWTSSMETNLRQSGFTLEDVESEARLIDRIQSRMGTEEGQMQVLQGGNLVAASMARQLNDLRRITATQSEQTSIAWARRLDEMDRREAAERRHEREIREEMGSVAQDRRRTIAARALRDPGVTAMRMQSLSSFRIPSVPALSAFLGLVLLLRPDPALAQLVDSVASAVGAPLEDAIEAMKAMLDQMGDTLFLLARQLLLWLIVLDLVWRGGKWALSGQSVGQVAEPMIYTIGIATMTVGFAAFVPEVVTWLVQRAGVVTQSVQPGTSGELSPTAMIQSGLIRVGAWLDAISLWDPESFFYIGCAFISAIAMAVQLAMVIVIYAEIFIVGLLGIVTLGFAGLSQTRDIATRYVMSLFGKAFKLLTLLLVVAATERMAQAAAGAGGDPTMAGALGAILLQFVGVTMIILLPGAVEQLVANSRIGDTAGSAGHTAAGVTMSGIGAARTAAGTVAGASAGSVAGAWKGARSAASLGGTAAATAAGIGALKGGLNWGRLGAERGITSELGARLAGRIHRLGTGAPEGQ